MPDEIGGSRMVGRYGGYGEGVAMDKMSPVAAGVLYGIAAGLAAGIVLAPLWSTPVLLPVPVGLGAGLAVARRFATDPSWASERVEHMLRSAGFVAALSTAAIILPLGH